MPQQTVLLLSSARFGVNLGGVEDPAISLQVELLI